MPALKRPGLKIPGINRGNPLAPSLPARGGTVEHVRFPADPKPPESGGGPMFSDTTQSNQYLLNDQFTTDRAAGAVNGTAAEPTGGSRVVVDSNSKLSITGGVASFETGGAAIGEPGLWYSSRDRTLGRIIVIDSVVTSGGQGFIFGWDIDQSGGVSDGILVSGVTLAARVAGVNITVGAVVVGTAYAYCVIHRGSGYYHYIKGGLFANWTLLWVSSVTTTTPIFPGIGASNTAATFTADNIRIPSALFIPAPLVYDAFTRANGALGLSEASGPDGQATPVSLWTGSTWAIVSNVAVNTPALGVDVVVNGAFAADTDWAKGAGWTIAGGLGVATAASANITQTVAPLVVGTWYQTSVAMAGNAGGTGNVLLGSTAFPVHSTNATFTETGLAVTTAFGFTATAGTFTIDNFTCQPLVLSQLLSLISLPATSGVIWDSVVSALGAGTQAGLAARWDSASSPANGLLGYFDGNGNIRLYEVVAGAYTSLLSVVKAYAAGDTLRLDLLGSAWRLYHITAAGTATLQGSGTTNVTSGVLFGNFSTSSGNTITSCVAYAKGGSDGWWNALNSL